MSLLTFGLSSSSLPESRQTDITTISQKLQSLTGRYLLCLFSVLFFVFWFDESQSVFVLQMQIYISTVAFTLRQLIVSNFLCSLRYPGLTDYNI